MFCISQKTGVGLQILVNFGNRQCYSDFELDQYCEMFDTFLQARLYALNIIHILWFKLNRATAHTARRTMETFEREVS